MKSFKSILYLLIFIFLSFLFPCQLLGATIGKITYLEGNVDITKPEEKAREVKDGDEIFEKDIIRTKSSSKCEITFNDSNILRIGNSSRVEISSYFLEGDDKDTIFSLSRGNIQNIVKSKLASLFGSKSKRKFEIHTKTAVIGVRGTDFFTYFTKNISGAVFKEGSGYCYNLKTPDKIYLIEAGQTFILTGPDVQPVLRPATPGEMSIQEEITSPTSGDLSTVDINTSVSDIVMEAETEDDITIENQRLLEQGIDDRLQTIDRIEEQRIDIPQPVHEIDQHTPIH